MNDRRESRDVAAFVDTQRTDCVSMMGLTPSTPPATAAFQHFGQFRRDDDPCAIDQFDDFADAKTLDAESMTGFIAVDVKNDTRRWSERSEIGLVETMGRHDLRSTA